MFPVKDLRMETLRTKLHKEKVLQPYQVNVAPLSCPDPEMEHRNKVVYQKRAGFSSVIHTKQKISAMCTVTRNSYNPNIASSKGIKGPLIVMLPKLQRSSH